MSRCLFIFFKIYKMATTSIFNTKNLQTSPFKKERKVAYISQETYYKKYRNREGHFKYEWLGGAVLKTMRVANKQVYIFDNLQTLFYKLLINNKLKGSFPVKMDTHIASTIRIPDMCYFNAQQEYDAAYDKHPIAEL